MAIILLWSLAASSDVGVGGRVGVAYAVGGGLVVFWHLEWKFVEFGLHLFFFCFFLLFVLAIFFFDLQFEFVVAFALINLNSIRVCF